MMARLFALTVFAYPLVLALLCLGAGLVVDRCSGRFLPLALLPAIGAAALVALSQLSTWITPLAPATPWLMLAFALLGFVLAPTRAMLARLRAAGPLLLVPPLVYLLALAPVLLAGRASFSSFMALSDSAVHMIGADYLIHHGQSYGGLDLSSSYDLFLENYYGTGYPSGADTLFGGSALLLGLPLIWAFQPFCGVLLALGTGPAFTIARRLGLARGWAALGAFAAGVPAIVYGYELVGSVKELLALMMLLALGALLALHSRWLTRGARRAVPCALVLAAGVSALGVGFGAWALAAGAVLLVVLVDRLRRGALAGRAVWMSVGLGGLVLLVAAWPTWRHLSQSLNVAQNIASTGNSGNLQAPLKWTQAFGVWLRGSYKQSPVGVAAGATYALIGVTLLACVLGAVHLLRQRRFALFGWVGLTVIVWIVLSRTATTWVDAKALVLTSPVLVLLAWGGVSALLETRELGAALLGVLLAVALVGGALASDLAQYHAANLAPTARYQELAFVGKRFRGRGPVLFADFDEYAMYELRGMQPSGPDFVYAPPALASLVSAPDGRRYGGRIRLELATQRLLSPYRLIVTRRDPSMVPPPAEYTLAWRGRYYEVWSRGRVRVPREVARGDATLTARPLQCSAIVRAARRGARLGARAFATLQPPIVRVPLARASHPSGWGWIRSGWAMQHPGTLGVPFSLPHGGGWQLWLRGQFMPGIDVEVDGRPIAQLAGQLSGNTLMPDPVGPLRLRLQAGSHRLTVTRTGFSLAPGNGGSAVLETAFLTPAGTPVRDLRALPLNAPRSTLCAKRYRRVELLAR